MPGKRALTEEMVFMRTKSNRMDLIKNLNLWGNDLQDISVLQYMPNLEVLSLSVNGVSSLADLRYCPKLSELYLRKNDIRDLSQVLHLKHLRQMRVLWLSDNPVATLPHYRLYVLHHLPNLTKFDSQDVTEDERRQAMEADVDSIETCVDGGDHGSMHESLNPEEAPESIFEPMAHSSPMAPQRRHSANEAFEDGFAGAPPSRVVPRSGNRRHTQQAQQQKSQRMSMDSQADVLPRSYSMPVEETMYLERQVSSDDRVMERPARGGMQAGGRRQSAHDAHERLDSSHAGSVHDERPLPSRAREMRDPYGNFDDRTPQHTPREQSRDYMHSPADRSPNSYHSDRGRDARDAWNGQSGRDFSADQHWQERGGPSSAWPDVARSPPGRRRGEGSSVGSSLALDRESGVRGSDPRRRNTLDARGHGHMSEAHSHNGFGERVTPERVPAADNILCAVLALIKELDRQGLELVRRAVEQRQDEL